MIIVHRFKDFLKIAPDEIALAELIAYPFVKLIATAPIDNDIVIYYFNKIFFIPNYNPRILHFLKHKITEKTKRHTIYGVWSKLHGKLTLKLLDFKEYKEYIKKYNIRTIYAYHSQNIIALLAHTPKFILLHETTNSQTLDQLKVEIIHLKGEPYDSRDFLKTRIPVRC